MTENVKNETVTKNLKTIFIDTFKKMFDFKTRASKYDYWGFLLVNNIVGIVFIFLAFLGAMLGTIGIYIYFGIYVAYVFVQAIATLSLSVRRLHDTNHSGKWLFLVLAPFVLGIVAATMNSVAEYQTGVPTTGNGFIILTGLVIVVLSIAFLVMMCRKGNAEENRFGKVVAENSNSNKLANICCLLYFVIAIISGVLNVVFSDEDKNTQANGVASGTAVVDTQNSESATGTTETTAAEDENVETPSVPLHESAE